MMNDESGHWNLELQTSQPSKLRNSRNSETRPFHIIHIFHISRIAVQFRSKEEENGQREEVSSKQ